MIHGKRIAFALLSALGVAGVQAQEQLTTYTGTVGKAPVVVELDLSDPTQVSGRYFYQRYHRDLALRGALDGDQLELNEGFDDFQETPVPVLILHGNAASGWQGQWQDPKGKTQAVAIVPAQLPAQDPDTDPFWHSVRSQSPYEFLRLSQLKRAAGQTNTFMGHTLQWQTEPESAVQLFEVRSGYPAAQLEVINRELRERLWNEVIAYHACMLGASRMGEGEFEQTVTPELMTPTLLSVSIFTSYNCGGAHPDFGDSPLNFDVASGQPLSLEDVLWLGEGKPWHYDDRDGATATDKSDVDFDTFSAYRQQYLGPWLVEQFKRLYPDQMQKTTDDDCDYSDPEVWRFPTWHFTPQGLYVGPGFARVMRACEGTEWSVVPWAVLAQHPGGVTLQAP